MKIPFIDSLIFFVANRVFVSRNPMLVWYYREYFGRTPNIADPQRYSERMLWRKILDRNPQFVVFSDKLATKDYIKKRCPDLPVPGTLWVGDDASAIPDGLLAGDVYLKANHGCNFNRRVRCGQPDRVSLREETGSGLPASTGTIAGNGATRGSSRSCLSRNPSGIRRTA